MEDNQYFKVRLHADMTHKIISNHQEYFKLMSTLNTGLILIIIAFVEKIFKEPKHLILVAISVIGFIVSLRASVNMFPILGNMLGLIKRTCEQMLTKEPIMEEMQTLNDFNKTIKNAETAHNVCSWAFLIGLIALLLFALLNLKIPGINVLW